TEVLGLWRRQYGFGRVALDDEATRLGEPKVDRAVERPQPLHVVGRFVPMVDQPVLDEQTQRRFVDACGAQVWQLPSELPLADTQRAGSGQGLAEVAQGLMDLGAERKRYATDRIRLGHGWPRKVAVATPDEVERRGHPAT